MSEFGKIQNQEEYLETHSPKLKGGEVWVQL